LGVSEKHLRLEVSMTVLQKAVTGSATFTSMSLEHIQTRFEDDRKVNNIKMVKIACFKKKKKWKKKLVWLQDRYKAPCMCFTCTCSA